MWQPQAILHVGDKGEKKAHTVHRETYASGKITAQPELSTRHSSGTRDVDRMIMAKMRKMVTRSGNQNLRATTFDEDRLYVQEEDGDGDGESDAPLHDLRDLLEEVRALDLLLRRAPRDVVREQVRQHRLAQRYREPTEEEKAASDGRRSAVVRTYTGWTSHSQERDPQQVREERLELRRNKPTVSQP